MEAYDFQLTSVGGEKVHPKTPEEISAQIARISNGLFLRAQAAGIPEEGNGLILARKHHIKGLRREDFSGNMIAPVRGLPTSIHEAFGDWLFHDVHLETGDGFYAFIKVRVSGVQGVSGSYDNRGERRPNLTYQNVSYAANVFRKMRNEIAQFRTDQ